MRWCPLESAAAVLAFATTVGQIRERHREPSETRAISRKQQLQSFLPQPRNRLDSSLGDTLKIKSRGVFYEYPCTAAKACVTSGPGPQRGGDSAAARATPKQPPLGSWCCWWCETLSAHEELCVIRALAYLCMPGIMRWRALEPHAWLGTGTRGGQSSHAGARRGPCLTTRPWNAASGEGANLWHRCALTPEPTENRAVGRHGWMPVHSAETPQFGDTFSEMILLSETNPLEGCDPDPLPRWVMPRAAGSAVLRAAGKPCRHRSRSRSVGPGTFGTCTPVSQRAGTLGRGAHGERREDQDGWLAQHRVGLVVSWVL